MTFSDVSIRVNIELVRSTGKEVKDLGFVSVLIEKILTVFTESKAVLCGFIWDYVVDKINVFGSKVSCYRVAHNLKVLDEIVFVGAS